MTTGPVSPDSGEHWTEPGAWPAAPGVHRIPLPLPTDGLKAVNVYVLETADGLTLIDAGWAIEVARDLLETALRSLGRTTGDITRFLVTHVHRDHYTQAVTVRRDFGSHISLGLGERPTLDALLGPGARRDDPHVDLLREAGAHDLAEQWRAFGETHDLDESVWGYPDAWLEADHPIEVGERTLDAIATPGHTQGHYVFADRAAGLLFAGDHVLPTITPSIGFEPVPTAAPLADFLGSLTKVRRIEDLTLLPAHGPVAPSAHDRIDELLVHHDVRLALCRDAVATAGHTSYEVATVLPWTRHERAFSELDVFNSALATLETRAHLELLVARGELTRRDGADGSTYALSR